MHIRILLASLLLLPLPLLACTAFVMHNNGRTFIGNNEDSWCTQGQVRFVPGVRKANTAPCTSAHGPGTLSRTGRTRSA
ncbi:MAG: hypothetical protein IPH05_07205 [Flavobacteriales bacterium]|nr:hypothetical protein [Flavobacteriales bacterium]